MYQLSCICRLLEGLKQAQFSTSVKTSFKIKPKNSGPGDWQHKPHKDVQELPVFDDNIVDEDVCVESFHELFDT